jgi:hypothetical protein
MEVTGELTPWGIIPTARWIRGSVCQRGGLDAVEKSLATAGNRTPVAHPIARRYTDCAVSILTPRMYSL